MHRRRWTNQVLVPPEHRSRMLAQAQLALLCGLASAPPPSKICDECSKGECLFNGLCLPSVWPPRITHSHELGGQAEAPPKPPSVIDISVGRQLFVDSWLIDGSATTGINITHHRPTYRDDVNPVLRATEVWESSDLSKSIPFGHKVDPKRAFAAPISGGLFWDPKDKLYKCWYKCGGGGGGKSSKRSGQCYATSRDGIAWEKPTLNVVKGTNIISTDAIDGSTVWLDVEEEDPTKRFKMAAVLWRNAAKNYTILFSADGVHWTVALEQSGPVHDRSTFFLNPMREPRKWIYSIKQSDVPGYGRARAYWESPQLDVANWVSSLPLKPGQHPTAGQAFDWTSADLADPPFVCSKEAQEWSFGHQLYVVDAVAFESVLVGLFTIFRGKFCPLGGNLTAQPPAPLVNRTGEWDSVFVAYSRDGFHWHRPVDSEGLHRVFLDMDSTPVKCTAHAGCDWRWNKAAVQSVGGAFTVENLAGSQTMRFYVSGRSGKEQLESNASMGVAELRRDGFTSVSAAGDDNAAAESQAVLTTQPVRFAKDRTIMFVNVEGEASALKVAILDAQTLMPLPGLETGMSKGEGERVAVDFPEASIRSVASRPIRVRFTFASSSAHLYSFWFAKDACGASQGWIAAGGAGFNSSRDWVGSCS